MNILFLCDEYPPGKHGGIGSAVQNLARELVRQGHKVVVAGLYSHMYGGDERYDDMGVQVYKKWYGPPFGQGDNLLYKLYRRSPRFIRSLFFAKKPLRSYIEFVRNLVKKESIDVVEITDWCDFTVQTSLAVNWPDLGAPLILKSHGSATKIGVEVKRIVPRYMKEADRLLFERADALAAVSAHNARVNAALFGLSKTTEVLYNGVRLESREEGARDKSQVVYAGSLTREKGVGQLLQAWKMVSAQRPDATLLLYGKGRVAAFSELLTGLEKQVRFMGHVSRAQLLEAFGASAVAVFPSYSESFSLVPLEAMSMGCAVVYTSRTSGPETVMHGTDGLLVDPDNVREIADAILSLLNDPALAERLGEAGRKKVEQRFSIAESARAHVAFYEKTARRYRQQGKQSEHA